MKKLGQIIVNRYTGQALGVAIGVLALYFSFKNVSGAELKDSISSVNLLYLIPIMLVNIAVVFAKALRWQLMIRPVKRVGTWMMFKILTIGFMANNVLPARLGEVLRIHLLGRDAEISKVSTTASLVADKVLEAVSFLMVASLLVAFGDVPKWLHYGLTVTLLMTVIAYTLALIYTSRAVKSPWLIKFQEGIKALSHWRIFSAGLAVSFVSWFLQLVMIYLVQLSFNVDLPLWSTLLVIISVNLAIAVPGAPAHLGTFEFACILAYGYLGINKETALVVGAAYHLFQVVPVTLAGGIMLLCDQIRAFGKAPVVKDPQASC